MKIKTKTLKKLIAILCAATMGASGAVVSVGAVDEKEIAQAREAATACSKKVRELEVKKIEIKKERDEKLKELDECIKKVRDNYGEAAEKNKKTLSEQQKAKNIELKIEFDEKNKKRIKRIEVDNYYKKQISELEEAINKAKKQKIVLNKRVKELIGQAKKEEKEKLEKEKLEKEKDLYNLRTRIWTDHLEIRDKDKLIEIFKDNGIEIDGTSEDFEDKLKNMRDGKKLEKLHREIEKEKVIGDIKLHMYIGNYIDGLSSYNEKIILKIFKDNGIETDGTKGDIENKLKDIGDIDKLKKIESEINLQIEKDGDFGIIITYVFRAQFQFEDRDKIIKIFKDNGIEIDGTNESVTHNLRQIRDLKKLEKIYREIEKEKVIGDIKSHIKCYIECVEDRDKIIKIFKDNGIEIDGDKVIKIFKDDDIEIDGDIENKIEDIRDIDKLEKIKRELKQQIEKEKEDTFNSLKRDTLCKIYLIKGINNLIKDINMVVNNPYNGHLWDKSSFAKTNNKEDIKNEIKHIVNAAQLDDIRRCVKQQLEQDRLEAMDEELGLEPAENIADQLGAEHRELELKKCEEEIKRVENKSEKEALDRYAKLQGYWQEIDLSLKAQKALDKEQKLLTEKKIAEIEHENACDEYQEAQAENNSLRNKYTGGGIVNINHIEVLEDMFEKKEWEYLTRKDKLSLEEFETVKYDLRKAIFLQKVCNTARNKLLEAAAKYDEVANECDNAMDEFDKLCFKRGIVESKNYKAYVDNQIRINKSLAEFDNYCNNLN